MKTLLIGSRALNYWHPEFKIKETTDWDIISHEEYEVSDKLYEWHPTETLNNQAILNFGGSGEFVNYHGHMVEVARPEFLALIKRSHLWRDLSFDKHITMYTRWLKRYHDQYKNRWLYDHLLKERIEYTEKEFPQHKISLKKTKDEFFDDYVIKKYDHDYLHELFAHQDRPLYERMQDKSIDSVFCHKQKWEEFSHEEKLMCIKEEAYVIATERFMVPKDWVYNERLAFYKAMCKICTTLTSGFFRDYAIDNFDEIMKSVDYEKFTKVQKILQTVA
jgi:hypothetical protein